MFLKTFFVACGVENKFLMPHILKHTNPKEELLKLLTKNVISEILFRFLLPSTLYILIFLKI
jgi:hypothetical protein